MNAAPFLMSTIPAVRDFLMGIPNSCLTLKTNA